MELEGIRKPTAMFTSTTPKLPQEEDAWDACHYRKGGMPRVWKILLCVCCWPSPRPWTALWQVPWFQPRGECVDLVVGGCIIAVNHCKYSCGLLVYQCPRFFSSPRPSIITATYRLPSSLTRFIVLPRFLTFPPSWNPHHQAPIPKGSCFQASAKFVSVLEDVACYNSPSTWERLLSFTPNHLYTLGEGEAVGPRLTIIQWGDGGNYTWGDGGI